MDHDDFAFGAGEPVTVKEHAAAMGLVCPECKSQKTESNGKREFRCVECDHRWGFDGERYGF